MPRLHQLAEKKRLHLSVLTFKGSLVINRAAQKVDQFVIMCAQAMQKHIQTVQPAVACTSKMTYGQWAWQVENEAYIVVLTAELLTAELVGGHNLSGTVTCL